MLSRKFSFSLRLVTNKKGYFFLLKYNLWDDHTWLCEKRQRMLEIIAERINVLTANWPRGYEMVFG